MKYEKFEQNMQSSNKNMKKSYKTWKKWRKYGKIEQNMKFRAKSDEKCEKVKNGFAGGRIFRAISESIK